MGFYRTTDNLTLDRAHYPPGCTVELTEAQAAPLLEDGVVEPAKGHKPNKGEAAARQSALVDAIGKLEKGNAHHWTVGGPPEVRALAEISGLERVTSKERDAAWAAAQEG